MQVFFILFLISSIKASQLSPANPDLGCDEVPLTPASKWYERFETVTLFDGFFKGKLTIYANVAPNPNDYMPYPAAQLDCIFNQYNNATTGVKWGEFYVIFPGAGMFYAGKSSINPIRNTNYVCQINYAPGQVISIGDVTSYSQMEMTNKYKMHTVNLVRGEVNHEQALSDETFHFANDTQSATDQLFNYKLGPTGVHSITSLTYIRWTRITEAQARDLGWTGSNPPIPDGSVKRDASGKVTKRGIHVGGKIGFIPVELLNEDAVKMLNL